jgi:hypothetical protein
MENRSRREFGTVDTEPNMRRAPRATRHFGVFSQSWCENSTKNRKRKRGLRARRIGDCSKVCARAGEHFERHGGQLGQVARDPSKAKASANEVRR